MSHLDFQSTPLELIHPIYCVLAMKTKFCQIKCVSSELDYGSYICIEYSYLNLLNSKFLNHRISKGYVLTAYYCLNARKGKSRNYNEKNDANKF